MRHLYFQPPTEHNQNWFYGQQSHHVLLQRRKELKMTQQQVADKANIQLRQYQRLESGERDITGSSGRIMLSICYALKLDPFLFEGKGNEAPEIKYVMIPPVEKESFIYVVNTGLDEHIEETISFVDIRKFLVNKYLEF